MILYHGQLRQQLHRQRSKCMFPFWIHVRHLRQRFLVCLPTAYTLVTRLCVLKGMLLLITAQYETQQTQHGNLI
jgi:hypothetical protein